VNCIRCGKPLRTFLCPHCGEIHPAIRLLTVALSLGDRTLSFYLSDIPIITHPRSDAPARVDIDQTYPLATRGLARSNN